MQSRLPIQPMAPLIALVGCDGSGKSTLSAALLAHLSAERRVASCYLGLGSGELGLRIARWPVVGAALARILTRKAGQSRDREKTIPGLATALVIFTFSLLRVRRFRRMMALRRRGVTVITDRYPQVEVPGFYDGPGLSAARAGSRAVGWLAALERRQYEWMAGFRPDIVLRLNVDLETALRRKPDHQRDLLAAKVAATSCLSFHGALIAEVDARVDEADVLRAALVAIAPVLYKLDRISASAH